MPSFDFSAYTKDYRQCRKRLTQQIASPMLDSMSRRELMRSAKKLHMWYKDTVVCGSEEESAVLNEFALFSHLHAFGSIALRWCNKQPAPSSTLDKCIFAGVRASFYSIFKVLGVFPRKGILLQDLYTQKTFPIMDVGVSSTAVVNLGLASRIIPISDWGMFTGAVIPMANKTYQALLPYLQKNIREELIGQSRPFSSKKEMLFQTTIIRAAMTNGGFESVAYEDI